MSTTQHEVDEAFLREARIGLMVLTALIALFLYVAFGKLSGWNQPEPVAFQQDGVAISNAADDPDSAEQRTASQDSPPGESQAAPRPEPPTNRPPSPISSSINRRPKSEPASVSAPRHAFSQESEAADSNPSLTPEADSFAPPKTMRRQKIGRQRRSLASGRCGMPKANLVLRCPGKRRPAVPGRPRLRPFVGQI